MSVLELIGHSLVCNVSVLVIKRQTLPGEFVALGFDGVRVVVPQDPFATGRMKSKRVPDAEWNIFAGFHFPSFDLDPVAIFLINDLVMKVKQRSDLVFIHSQSISPDDIYSNFIHNFFDTYYVASDTPDAAYWSTRIECEKITVLVQSLVQRRIPTFSLLNQQLKLSGFDSHNPLQAVRPFKREPRLGWQRPARADSKNKLSGINFRSAPKRKSPSIRAAGKSNVIQPPKPQGPCESIPATSAPWFICATNS